MDHDRPLGLVIAGGAAVRFGAEKGVQTLGGRPLLAWSLAALDGVCGAVAVSVRPESETWRAALDLGRDTVGDGPGRPSGPLAGLAAGLDWARKRHARLLATLPTDVPGVTPWHLERLVDGLGDAAAAYATSPGGLHPLCAVWRTDLHTSLAARLDAGEHPPVRRWLAEIRASPVTFEDDAPFANVNSAADLAALEATLA